MDTEKLTNLSETAKKATGRAIRAVEKASASNEEYDREIAVAALNEAKRRIEAVRAELEAETIPL